LLVVRVGMGLNVEEEEEEEEKGGGGVTMQ
jgi:hypothetical protein